MCTCETHTHFCVLYSVITSDEGRGAIHELWNLRAFLVISVVFDSAAGAIGYKWESFDSCAYLNSHFWSKIQSTCVTGGRFKHFIIYKKSYSWTQKEKYSEAEIKALVNYIQCWLFWLKTKRALNVSLFDPNGFSFLPLHILKLWRHRSAIQ